MKAEKIFKEVIKGSEKTKLVKRAWIEASFVKHRVAKKDYEATMEEVYNLLINAGYDVA